MQIATYIIEKELLFSIKFKFMQFPKEEEFQKQRLLVSKLDKLRYQLQEANSRLHAKEDHSSKLKKILEKEQRDVEKLDKLNLSSLFYSVLGNKDEKQEKERQEYLKSKLQYDEAIEEITLIKENIEKLQIEIDLLKSSKEKYQILLQEKEEFLLTLQNVNSKNLQRIIKDIEYEELQIQETNEALHEAEPAMHYLNETFKQLESAENWGTFDMIGGGLIVTSIKHGKIDQAKSGIAKAQFHLDNFVRELQDVHSPEQLSGTIDIGKFNTFGDYFFDGLIFDFIVQEKISKSKSHVQRVYLQVSRIENKLKNRLKELENKIENLEQQKLQFLNNID